MNNTTYITKGVYLYREWGSTLQIAVIISNSHLIGWSTTNGGNQDLATDPLLVEMVLNESPRREIIERANYLLPGGHYPAAHGTDLLQVSWVAIDRPFRIIRTSDGTEGIEYYNPQGWIHPTWIQPTI